MSNKIINLDDLKNTVTLQVEKKEFVISKITLEARQIYGELLTKTGRYLALTAEAKGLGEKTKEELEELNERLQVGLDDFVCEKKELLEKLMKIILEKNGYPFDKKWWYDNTDFGIMEKFVYAALKKDEQTDEEKKKVAEDS